MADGVFGIDISRYQRDIDFNVARGEGVKFAILKASQADFTDSSFGAHYNNAKAHGMGVGAYHYLTATTVQEAEKEAKYAAYGPLKDRKFEYPIFADVEDVFIKRLSKEKVDEVVTAFCETLEKAGFWAGFYCNFDFYKNHMNGEKLADRFSFWLASWSLEPPVPCQMWQFGGETNLLRSNRVGGEVCDQDFCYRDFPSLIAAKGLNGFAAPDVSFGKFKVGDTVRVKPDAPVYRTKTPFNSWVYSAVFFVRQVTGDRVVIAPEMNGPITGAVAESDLVAAM